MPRSATLGPIPFLLAGGGNTNFEVGPIDLSGVLHITLRAHLTGKGSADAGDTLDIYFQQADDDVTPTWDDKAHFQQFTGAMTVSAAAPEKWMIEWPCDSMPMTVTDASREPSGSAGAARLAAGAYYPGPLRGKRRSVDGWLSRYRFRYEVVDANNNSAFAGNLFIEYVTRGP